jgi:hypothetical protein
MGKLYSADQCLLDHNDQLKNSRPGRLFYIYRMRSYLICLVAAFFFISCGGSGNVPAPGVESSSGMDTKAAVRSVALDSMDILFFTKPFTDSTRYTRYFSTVKVSDSSFFNALETALNGPSAVLEKPRPCLSEGKIILPKGGDAFKVIYFSRSKETSCNYIYDIRDGLFYYHPLSLEISAGLSDFETRAEKVQ